MNADDELTSADLLDATAELIESVRGVQGELRVVYDAIDDLRQTIERLIREHGRDEWRPAPIVSFPVDSRDPEFARKINAVDPDELPGDLPASVRSAVAARLRESQRSGGLDFRAEPHRQNDRGNGKLPPADFSASAEDGLEEDEDLAAEPPKTPQKEEVPAVDGTGALSPPVDDPSHRTASPEEPAAREKYRYADWCAYRQRRLGGQIDAAGLVAEYRRMTAGRKDFVAALVNSTSAGALQTIAEGLNVPGARRHKPARNAEEIYFSCLAAVAWEPRAVHRLGPPIDDEDRERFMLKIIDADLVAEREESDEPDELPTQLNGDHGSPAEGPPGVYTLDDWTAFRARCQDGQVGAAALQAEFRQLTAAKRRFIETLVTTKSADQLRRMAVEWGTLDARRNTKQKNAEALYRACLTAFTLGDSVSYQPLQETYEEAVERIELAITDEQIAAQRDRVRRNQKEKDKAFSNPETLLDFATFIRERGVDELSDKQFARWDALHADRIRDDRKSQKQRETVEQFQSDEIADLDFRITEGYHDREKIPLWIVQLPARVERETFQELKVKATQLGGWWSSFKQDSAGFQFRSRESADKFVGLAAGDADRSEELQARKLRKLESASERLHAVAETLEAKATEVLEADDAKLKNTARRADMAASLRAQAYSDQADAKTLRSIAAALDRGEAKYLDGVWNAAQVRSLKTILLQARRERIKVRLSEEGKERQSHGWSQRYDELEGETLSTADVRCAVYPKPYLYRGHLVQAFAQLENKPGMKQVASKMRKMVDLTPTGQDFVEFTHEHQVKLLEEFLGRAKAAGVKAWHFDHCLDAYKRLQSANIYDAHELRAALRELVPHLAAAAADDPVKRAEDDLRGQDLPGFFPTPGPVIARILEQAGIEPTHRVLEPSCGKGDVLDAVRRECPDVTITALERNLTLQGVLTAKGYDEIVSYGDFLNHEGEYDRIVMNPPFEQGQDMTHVRHAYDQLAPGGRVVSVMSDGPFFRQDANSQSFRRWLADVTVAYEQLPEDAFQGVEAFRQTSVRTKLVIIDKP